MIKSFKDKKTEKIYSGLRFRESSGDTQIARRKMHMLNAATIPEDLILPPGNRNKLATRWTRPEIFCIKVNERWIITFTFTWEEGAKNVTIENYYHMTTDDEYLPPIHPGEILDTEFMQPLKLPNSALSRALSVPIRQINEIIHGKHAITADTAMRLSRLFGTSAKFWLNLQAEYELDCITYTERTKGKDTFDFIQPIPQVADFDVTLPSFYMRGNSIIFLK